MSQSISFERRLAGCIRPALGGRVARFAAYLGLLSAGAAPLLAPTGPRGGILS